MKRLLSILLVLVFMIGAFTSCDNLPFDLPFDLPGTDNKVEEADINEVVKQLDDMYEDDNGESIPSGTELIARLKLGGTEFTITWTSDNADVKIELVDGLYVVTLPKNTGSQSEYKLIATITSPGGQSAKAEYNRVLAESFGMITNPVAGTAYKLALLHGNENGVVYFDGTNYNNYAWYLAYTTNQLAAVDVYLEAVEGVEGGYRLYFMNGDAKTYIVAYPRDNDTTKGTLKLDTAVPTEYFTYSTEYNTLVYTSVTGQQFYMGSSGTYKSISCSALSYITSPTSYPVRLYGAGGVEEKLPEQNLPELPENPTVKDIIDASEELLTGQKLEVNFTVTGVISGFKYSYDPGYNNVSPKVVVEGKEIVLYRISGEGADTIKVGDTITVFVTGITRFSDKEWQTLSGGLIKNVVPGTGETPTPTPGTEMSIPDVLASAEGTNVIVKGTVSAIYQAWNDEYSNISFYITDDAGNTLLVFRTGTKVVVGDQVTVTGTTALYNEVIQIAQGATTVIDVPASGGSTSTTYGAPVEGTAYKLYLDQKTAGKTLYFTGSMDGNYLATTDSLDAAVEIFFEVVDGGYHIYFMNGETKTYINAAAYLKDSGYAGCHFELGTEPICVWTFNTTYGILEVYGEIEGKSDTFFAGTYGSYNTISLSGAYYKDQITSGTQYPARLVLSDGTTPPVGDGEGGESGSGSGTVTPPAGGEMSIPDVLASAAGTSVVVKGTVSSIYQAWNDEYSNISFYITDDAGNKLLVFRTGTKVSIGDQVTVTGTTTLYNEVIQIAQGATTVIDVAHGDNHTYENGFCTACGKSQATLKDLSFTSTANRTSLTANQQVWEQNGIKVINDQAESTSDIADYSNPARFYKSTSITIECAGMTKIVFNVNDAKPIEGLTSSLTGDNYTVTVQGNLVIVEFDSAVDSITFSVAAQFRLNGIQVA